MRRPDPRTPRRCAVTLGPRTHCGHGCVKPMRHYLERSWINPTLVARRDIVAGEEITLDQGIWNFDDDEYVWDQPHCTCGSPLCRKILTNDDWQRADVQERYRDHFHPFVQRMIEGRSRRISL